MSILKSLLKKNRGTVLLALAVPLAMVSTAAYGQLNFAQAEVARAMRESSSAMKDYASSHDHFPSNNDEFDDCLKMLYKRVSLTDPDSTLSVQSDGKYRTWYQFAITMDSSYKGIPIVNGVAKVPDGFTGPPGKIVIMSDGADHCVGWAAGPDGKPVTENGNAIYFEQSIPKKSTSN
jgi:hypothetical protein